MRRIDTLAELTEIEEYLAGPDRFMCEKYNCNMLKSACVTRQKNAERNDRVSSPRYHRPRWMRSAGIFKLTFGNFEW
jgi:hypothetical protein